ncbi:MAG TPA: hypothetical protein VKW08_07705 [Xanthobacteraceae bacterium]|nr:hypothetical protein [Xanthobacteraceae bacterium]
MDTKTLLGTVARTALKAAAGAAVAHGWINDSDAEMLVGGGMVAAAGMWSAWNDYGRVMAIASLEILRAKVLDAAAKARANQIAPQSALAQLDAHVAATTAK